MPPVGTLDNLVERTSRSALVVGLVAALVMVVAVLAASSGPVDVWSNMSTTDQSADAVDPGDALALPEPDRVDVLERGAGGGLLNVVAGLAIAALLGATLIFANGVLRSWLASGPRGRFQRTAWETDAPSDGSETRLRVDIVAARAHLAKGTPRHAIVECWMQLERDAAAVGLSRPKSETSTEYVERVVAASSVDPTPIAELAELYREARFSRHGLTDSHRERAMDALHRVVAALGEGATA